MGKISIVFYASLIAALFLGVSARSASAKVSGIVFDEHQRPVAHATVSARPVGRPISGRIPETTTDIRGHFTFDDLEVGSYLIFATKEALGTSFAYFNTEPWVVQLTVNPDKDTAGVVIRLSKLARLQTMAIDAKTGRKVTNAQLYICRLDNPNRCMGAPANWPDSTGLLVPATTFRIRVRAPGYAEWESESPVLFQPETTKSLTIRLTPRASG